jgi:hypothetical protein
VHHEHLHVKPGKDYKQMDRMASRTLALSAACFGLDQYLQFPPSRTNCS